MYNATNKLNVLDITEESVERDLLQSIPIAMHACTS